MLKLAKLPDRTPVKIGITVTPDIAHALADYVALYNRTYADKAEVADLIPACSKPSSPVIAPLPRPARRWRPAHDAP